MNKIKIIIASILIFCIIATSMYIINPLIKSNNKSTTSTTTTNIIEDTTTITSELYEEDITTTTTTNTTDITSTNVIESTTTTSTTSKTTKITNTTTKKVEQIVSDKQVIPDKYNTGISGNLTKYTIGDNLQGLLVKLSGETTMSINFNHTQNRKNVVIENYDFTKYDKLQILTGDVTSKITYTFKNCKFNNIYVTPNMNDLINLQFENSTMKNFGGSNATFKKCRFGQGTGDAINPYKNVYIYDSYIADVAAYSPDKEIHYDGLQIYGLNSDTSFVAHDLHVYNTRFEIPAVLEVRNGIPSKGYVNAPIMVQLEFSDGRDISFENVIVNGGGYSVYVNLKQKNADHTISINNVSFRNVKLGYAHLYGKLYPVPDENINNLTFNNFDYYDSLYISSVWKDKQGVHVITTNDTLVDRNLTCVTNNNTYQFRIHAHPKLTKSNYTNYKFSDLPYDIDVVVNDKNAQYVKCYDTTTNSNLTNSNLIRTQKL